MPRNSVGTYSLPAGNPVSGGTVISTSWANGTMGDFAAEITNSLSRDDAGPMRAKLRHVAGSSAIPSVTFVDDEASGLYLGAASDIRMAVASTDIQKWTPTTTYFFNSLNLAKGAVVTNSTTNGAGLTATGNGSGAGVSSTGGATGVGLYGQGGASGAVGVQGQGTGTGGGVLGTGGASGAVGVSGFGSGSSAGVGALGGPTNGVGVDAAGQGTGVGGAFANGTAATATTPRNAVLLTNGYLAFSGVTNPNSNVGFSNTLTPLNTPKAWAKIVTGASTAISEGFNIASVGYDGSGRLQITFATALGTSSYCAIAMSSTAEDILNVQAQSTTVLTLNATNRTATINLQTAPARSIYVLVLGIQ